MGCKASKPETGVDPHTSMTKKTMAVVKAAPVKGTLNTSGSSNDASDTSATTGEKSDRIYKLLAKAQNIHDDSTSNGSVTRQGIWQQVLECCEQDPRAAAFQNPTTKSTPLHMAVRLIDRETAASVKPQNGASKAAANGSAAPDLIQLIQVLVKAHPDALATRDASGNIPLHYAIAPTTRFHDYLPITQWNLRADIVRLLISSDFKTSQEYMKRNNVVYDSGDATGGCTPLYRVLQTLPDDFEPKGPTYQYMVVVTEASPGMAGVGNQAEGDKPLALLYRRFTRQFDISEKFFAGDNSRPEVVDHRRKFKAAAGNTWKMIELLLRPTPDEIAAQHRQQQAQGSAASWRIVHRAVQVETPPDLLRYIVETNPEDLTQVDDKGNSPLHYAAASKPPKYHHNNHHNNPASFPAFYTKYVVDELLYKFPEGAQTKDAHGQYPLTLAINSGKQWIGGGIKSLYDAYPEALEQTNLEPHPNLKRILSMAQPNGDDADDDGDSASPDSPSSDGMKDSVIKDEQHDAIMLVQQEDVDVAEVTTSMWAHEEDAGVQMLGCVAISKLARAASEDAILRISLGSVAAVVNAMKAHPNEVIVQEKACHALRLMASADGKREVSFVASGAVAAIVGAMQAHVGDGGVQEEACAAIAAIVHFGGADRATIVASVSGLTAIVNAIAAHPDAAGVQHYGCRALLELTEFPNANLPELHRSQTAPLLEAAKASFPKECREAAELVLSRMS